MTLAAHFRTMAYNNAWSNHRLLHAVAQLDDEAFRAPRVGFFPSLARTLNHIVTVDWFYVDALERALAGHAINEDPYRFFEPPEPFASCAPLRAAQTAVDRRLLALCQSLDAPGLDVAVGIQRRRGLERTSVTRILAHLFMHQIHHRGQAHAMLSSTRVAPPQLDEFFCEEDASIHEADFTELGFTEQEIWSSS